MMLLKFPLSYYAHKQVKCVILCFKNTYIFERGDKRLILGRIGFFSLNLILSFMSNCNQNNNYYSPNQMTIRSTLLQIFISSGVDFIIPFLTHSEVVFAFSCASLNDLPGRMPCHIGCTYTPFHQCVLLCVLSNACEAA